MDGWMDGWIDGWMDGSIINQCITTSLAWQHLMTRDALSNNIIFKKYL